MICPQCHIVYPDDSVFCLNDGNQLIEGSGEQETIVIRHFREPSNLSAIHSGRIDTACDKCGLENRRDSKYCKKCGASLAGKNDQGEPAWVFKGAIPSGSEQNVPLNDTVIFRPPTPNLDGAIRDAQSNRKTLGAIFVSIASLAILGVVILLFNSDGDQMTFTVNNSSNQSNLNSNNKSSDSNSSTLPDAFDRTYTGGVGNRELSMSLHRDGGTLSGRAETGGSWDDLHGTIENDGNFTVDARERGGPHTGYWNGRIHSDGTIRGFWSDLQGIKRRDYFLSQSN